MWLLLFSLLCCFLRLLLPRRRPAFLSFTTLGRFPHHVVKNSFLYVGWNAIVLERIVPNAILGAIRSEVSVTLDFVKDFPSEK